jgi:hypothetical protein
MPQPRKPTALLELTGALAHDPGRYAGRQHEPQTDEPVGDPSEWMSERQKAIWVEFVAMAHDGVITRADRHAVEIAVALIDEFRSAPRKFAPAKYAQLRTILASFGMTPADRSRVTAKPKKDVNPFEELLQ